MMKPVVECGTSILGTASGEGRARLSICGDYTCFSFGGKNIRFLTSKKLVRYTSVRKWEDGYIEVGADYGKGEVEEYIDLRPILDNLYYDTDEFLRPIKSVEVRHE